MDAFNVFQAEDAIPGITQEILEGILRSGKTIVLKSSIDYRFQSIGNIWKVMILAQMYNSLISNIP